MRLQQIEAELAMLKTRLKQMGIQPADVCPDTKEFKEIQGRIWYLGYAMHRDDLPL